MQLHVRFTRNCSRKPEGTSLLGDWIFRGFNINVAVKVIRWEDVNRINFIEDGDHCWAFEIPVMNLRLYGSQTCLDCLSD